MIKITFPDGANKNYKSGVSVLEVANSISEGLARNVLSAKYNNQVVETTTTLDRDGNIIFFTWNNDEGKSAFWHSSAHIMAEALEFYYPGINLAIGPAIENGFYYDADFGNISFSEKDLPELEKKFIELARNKSVFKMRSCSKHEALSFYKNIDNQFKVELSISNGISIL